MDKKIVIATTFRDFNGSANDKIQRLFLESVKNQNYQNYLLAVTIFKEKNVATVLAEEGIPHIIFQGDTGEHRYSLTQVFLNGIKVAKENKDSILLWTTCDVIFDTDFFEKIAEKTGGQTCGTSYPHLTYQSFNDYKDNKNSHLLWYGIDSIFFSSDTFTEPKAEETIEKYRNEGWGHGDYLLTAFGLVFCKNMLNIRAHSKIRRIANDREILEETGDYLSDSDKDNHMIFRQFINDFYTGKKSVKSLDSSAIFLSYKFGSEDFWMEILVHTIMVIHPIKRSILLAIHKIKTALKTLFRI